MELHKALYLIPVNLSDGPLGDCLPALNFEVISHLKYFIVENVRTARRFIKRCNPSADIGEMTFFELNRHTDEGEIHSFLNPLRNGMPMGVMSEAGCPGVADPGAQVVSIAQAEGMKIVPLVGPSSILLSLMGSGFNGQTFSFHGYLPIEPKDRERKIRELEDLSGRHNMTQIFIETPYRNNKLLDSLIKTLRRDTKICVACDLTDPENETIITRTVSDWKKSEYNFDKRPAIFLIYAR